MQYSNEIMPTQEQMAGFMEPDDGSPVYRVNLLKYNEKAEYADGRETQLSGREAYALYAEGVGFKGELRWLRLVMRRW